MLVALFFPIGMKNYFNNSADGEDNSFKEIVEQIAHDICGPLSFLELYVKELSNVKKSKQAGSDEIADAAKRSLERIYGIIESLKNSAREMEPVFSDHDFSSVVRGVISEVTPSANKRGVKICYSGPSHLIGKFDEAKVSRAVQNLILNSIEASGAGDMISVVLMNSGRSVWIEVADTGKGVPLALRDRIFERGFSFGKDDGSGLGLAYCKSVAEMHGGTISVLSREGEGAVFTLCFPLSAMLSASHCPISGKTQLAAADLDDLEGQCEHWIAAMLEKYSSVEFVNPRKFATSHADCESTLDPL